MKGGGTQLATLATGYRNANRDVEWEAEAQMREAEGWQVTRNGKQDKDFSNVLRAGQPGGGLGGGGRKDEQ